jgi:hypothetical protein
VAEREREWQRETDDFFAALDKSALIIYKYYIVLLHWQLIYIMYEIHHYIFLTYRCKQCV